MSLKKLFQEMYELTKPECGNCINPYKCCAKKYCEEAMKYTKEVYGIDLTEKIVNSEIPFLSNTGCVLDPELRPICTLHHCDINAFGRFRGKPEVTEKYYELRSAIMKEHDLSMENHLQWLEEAHGRGEINDDIYEVAKALHSVPVAYVEQQGLRYTWITEEKMIIMLIAKDGRINVLMRSRSPIK